MVRAPAVAGSFYPAVPERLRADVRRLLPAVSTPAPAVGVVVPHAGYVYSGAVAGAVYARVARPDTCVILGPNHTGLGAPAALMRLGAWETPLGRMAIDQDLAERIQAHASSVTEDPRAHAREHAIEVQLPFLQQLGAPRTFVPLCLGHLDFAACAEIGAAVAAAIREAGRATLLIASTDMSHYLSREAAEAQDRPALEAMLALEPARLHETVRRRRISMCGVHAATAMLVAARALGATRAALVQYTDSGAVTGTVDQVVAYAGLTVH